MALQTSGDPRSDVLRDSAFRECAEGGCTDGLIERYFRHVADEDLASLGGQNLHGLLHAHKQLAAQRPPGRANVHVLHPSLETDGWNSPYAVLQIVTDDMPFLVDSVTAALAQLERRVHLVIHPQLWVERDATGELLQILDTDEQPAQHDGPAAVAESWMHLQIDLAADDAADAAMIERVRGVLDDVRDSVTDWERMRAQCEARIHDLETNPPAPVAKDIIEDRKSVV